ncbi:hypothetical protein TRFO_03937 [Tritrichomonas foetus]|uniref:Uncharacterized protein n=1 Tax=Tritrichomonas foetus TaxID=1144522 RepID=A0A1J4KPH4_9EUKA|nr:hypothetical protein TRFO_03937 [Tritrichomonas foetus]|eukprot:OHT11692.1 hypothetical protein TRFO_03937 [Tritrichomonas foetus]
MNVYLFNPRQKNFYLHKKQNQILSCESHHLFIMSSKELAKKVIAIDTSGSTSGGSFYWHHVKNILNANYSEGDLILSWSNKIYNKTYEEMMNIILSKCGQSATYPEIILEYLHQTKIFPDFKIPHLILITDGLVSVDHVDLCDQLIKQYSFTFENFTGYIIGEKKYANMSVTCPFSRNCPHTIYFFDQNTKEKEEIISVSSQDLKIISEIKNINNITQFNMAYESLDRALTSRLLGTKGDVELRKEVLKMKNRILESKSQNNAEDAEDVDNLTKALKEDNLDLALKIGSTYFSQVNISYEQKINALIRMCDGGLRLIFDKDEIKCFKMQIAETPEERHVLDIDSAPLYDGKSNFVCPITYENESDPVILILAPKKPILSLLTTKFDTEFIVGCPLNIFRLNNLIGSFMSCIDHPISLKSMIEAEKCGCPITKSPLTRKQIVGGIPLGSSEEHVSAANWTLCQILSGGKILGDNDMWFAVLWILVKLGKIKYLTDVEPFIREQMIFRLQNHFIKASLTELSTLPCRKLPLATACWFCLSSPFFSPAPPKKQNLLRYHLAHAQALVMLVDIVGYKLPIGLQTALSRTRLVSTMLRMKKENPKKFENEILSLYQKTVNVNVQEDSSFKEHFGIGSTFLPLDGHADLETVNQTLSTFPKIFRDLSIEEVVWLSKFVDCSKSSSEQDFPLLEDPPSLDTLRKGDSWTILDQQYQKFEHIKICPKTMRPYFTLNGKDWRQHYTETFGKDAPVFEGLDRTYGMYVFYNKKFPTLDEYLLGLYRKAMHFSKTLPSKIVDIAKYRMKAFEEAKKDLTVSEFTKLFMESADSFKRRKMETNSNEE